MRAARVSFMRMSGTIRKSLAFEADDPSEFRPLFPTLSETVSLLKRICTRPKSHISVLLANPAEYFPKQSGT